jgi:hypothetical protein
MEFNYNASPTASDFHLSNSFVRLLFGPVGCGKTVASCMEGLLLAYKQEPSPVDGIRKTRGAIIRNTYPELKSTTIKTWLECFPEYLFGKMKWDSPITHHIKFDDFHAEIMFISLDSETDVKKLLSLELTWAYINESRFVPKSIFDAVTQRVGRYPTLADGGPTHSCVFMDTNPPDDDHWIYKIFEEEKPEGFEIFKYPPAVLRKGSKFTINPDAENLHNIKNGEEYYLRQIPGKDDEWIKVYLEGKYGTVIDGRPVFNEYNDRIHCTEDSLLPLIGQQIGLGWDFGLTPSVVITQLTPRGQLRVLDELVSEEMGLTQFITNIVLPHLNKHYPWWKTNYVSIGDPAGNQRAQTDEKTCMDILRVNGITTLSAITNAFVKRREAIAFFLTKLVDGEPAFLLSPSCKYLRKGFLGAYHYKRIKVGNESAFHDVPVKNSASHPHDAMQYISMHYHAQAGRPVKVSGNISTKII